MLYLSSSEHVTGSVYTDQHLPIFPNPLITTILHSASTIFDFLVDGIFAFVACAFGVTSNAKTSVRKFFPIFSLKSFYGFRSYVSGLNPW